MTMQVSGWPRCAICGTPVQMVESVLCPISDRIRVSVMCHGEVETEYLTVFTLMDSTGVEFGTAFNQPRITAPEGQT